MRHHRLVRTRHNKLVMIYEEGGLMPSPNEKLAESLDVLKAIQEGNQRVFRSGDQWHLSPEQSLFLHGERTVIPDQLVVHSPKATNNDIKLLFGTTLYDFKVAEMPPPAALTVREGLRLFTAAAALVRVPESFFQLYPLEAQVVMASLADASDLLRLLLNGGHSAKAGSLAKAFR